MRNTKYPVTYFSSFFDIPDDYDRQVIITDVNGKREIVGLYSPSSSKYNKEHLKEDLGKE